MNTRLPFFDEKRERERERERMSYSCLPLNKMVTLILNPRKWEIRIKAASFTL